MEASLRTRRAEMMMLVILAVIQFTHVVDFIIMMPLAPWFQEAWHITNAQFGMLVAAFQFAAGIACLVSGVVADNFDRKKFLLFFYAGFIAATVGCGFASSYEMMMVFRVLAGICGGLISSTTLAILGDEVPRERRGYATGVVMSSFSIASALGVPLGLLAAVQFDWHMPFYLIGALSVPFFILAWQYLPAMRSHMGRVRERSVWDETLEVVLTRNHLWAFALMGMMVMGMFMVIPFIAKSYEANVGIDKSQIFYVYLVGGVSTMLIMPLAGRLADRYGEVRIFTIGAFLTVIPLLLVTHLGRVPLWQAVAVTTMFMVFSSARTIPGMSLITMSVQPQMRGRFMSVNIAVRELINALAVSLAGFILLEGPHGEVLRYEVVGYIAAVTTILAIPIAMRIRKV
ncbi:MAG: MFS transporter [Bacteroidetes bacterium]|nr:MFS transporter [Bacteroidota bacterium]